MTGAAIAVRKTSQGHRRPGRSRSLLRAGHLAAAVPFLLYLYGPLEGSAALRDLLRALTAPGLVLSGLALWQQPRVLSAIRRRRARTASAAAPGPR
ncbi:MAG TPA: hypothetical protein VML96_02280 [Egibacteraceae bacterium]|nr:hypothetical protein [Egibacteraceae bacterium]